MKERDEGEEQERVKESRKGKGRGRRTKERRREGKREGERKGPSTKEGSGRCCRAGDLLSSPSSFFIIAFSAEETLPTDPIAGDLPPQGCQG